MTRRAPCLRGSLIFRTAAARLLALCLGLLPASHSQALDARSIPAVKAGETARVDVLSPFPLVILDKENTAELKLKEAQRIPAVFRWEVGSVGRVGAELRERFDAERSRFLATLAATYKTFPVAARTAGDNSFRRFVTSYQATNQETFLTVPIARMWATNGNDMSVLNRMEERLTRAAARYVIPDHLGPESKLGWTIRLVVAEKNQLIDPEDAEQSKVTVRRNELVPLSKARSELHKEFQSDERLMARFCATLLRPNCFPEEEATREARAARVRNVISVHRFAAGDPIVRAGEIASPVAATALDETRLRLLAAEAQRPMNIWYSGALWIGTATFLVASGLLAWSIQRRRSATKDLQVATRKGAEADPLLREQIAIKVTRLLGYGFIQKLLADRDHSIKAQAIAASEAQEIQARIELIQQRMQQRYADYETRISQLERELEAAEEQNRELIRAKIVLARQELDQFEAANQSTSRWN